jgi:hypothetical protein
MCAYYCKCVPGGVYLELRVEGFASFLGHHSFLTFVLGVTLVEHTDVQRGPVEHRNSRGVRADAADLAHGFAPTSHRVYLGTVTNSATCPQLMSTIQIGPSPRALAASRWQWWVVSSVRAGPHAQVIPGALASKGNGYTTAASHGARCAHSGTYGIYNTWRGAN